MQTTFCPFFTVQKKDYQLPKNTYIFTIFTLTARRCWKKNNRETKEATEIVLICPKEPMYFIFRKWDTRGVDRRKPQPVARKSELGILFIRMMFHNGVDEARLCFLESTHSLREPRVIQFWRLTEWKSTIDLTFIASPMIRWKIFRVINGTSYKNLGKITRLEKHKI